MKIKYTVGKKSLEVDYFPREKGEYLSREEDYIFDLSDDELARMIVFAKHVAVALKKAFPCKKVGMAVLGLEVAHAHIHLIPMQSEKDMDFHREKLCPKPEEMKEAAEKISAYFEI